MLANQIQQVQLTKYGNVLHRGDTPQQDSSTAALSHLGLHNSVAEGCAAHSRIFSSTVELYPLGASRMPPSVVIIIKVSRHCLMSPWWQSCPSLKTTVLHREETCEHQAGKGERMNREIWIDTYTLLCIKQITNENLLYVTGLSALQWQGGVYVYAAGFTLLQSRN